jgi:PPOX class probable F420-dependent enzyme
MATQTIERPLLRRTADLEARFPGRYLSVTSFKRDGTGVATPVWAVSEGRRLYALTDRRSAKIRRLRRNPQVLVAPCRASGKLRGEPVPARAEVLTAEADLERVQALLLARYPVTYRLVMLGYRLGRRLRGRRSVADGAALAITVGSGERRPSPPLQPVAPDHHVPGPWLDDGSHTPPHGDVLVGTLAEHGVE